MWIGWSFREFSLPAKHSGVHKIVPFYDIYYYGSFCSKYYIRLCHASEQCVFVVLVLIMLIGSKCYVTCVICLAI